MSEDAAGAEPRDQRRIDTLFKLSLLGKAFDATTELVSGLALLFIKASWVLDAARWLSRHELADDPGDPIGHWLMQHAHALSVGTKDFWAAYLIGHAAAKYAVIYGLIKRISWAYPASIVVLLGFVAYQLYRYSYTHALSMLVLSAFDVFVIVLIVLEYRRLRASGQF